MSSRIVRRLRSEDFAALMALDEEIFGATGESVLGPYYLRLCCDFFSDTCFVAEDAGRLVGYVLCFVRAREAYCTTLAVRPEMQGSRTTFQLLRSLIAEIAHRVDSCWFTVKTDNHAARSLHATLGAREMGIREEFYGPGDRRIASTIDRRGFERIRDRLQRLGLVARQAETAAEAAA